MTERKPALSTDAKARKDAPIARGLLDYFPNALAAVAELSRIGNEQHNPGQPMHWAREKSTDHADCIVRHLIDRGTVDTDGVRHATKVAWRALALLQTELEETAQKKPPEDDAACATADDTPKPLRPFEGAAAEVMEREARRKQQAAYEKVAGALRNPDTSAIDVVWGCNHRAYSRFSDALGYVRCAGCGAVVTGVKVDA